MIHSLYSNREIFLRELISNASDACDKLRFEALARTARSSRATRSSRSVSITTPAARTLTVADNGVGMSRDEVIANLGTIAKSGTREFFSQLTGDQQKDAQSDRPVRRRVLLVVHRRRPRHGADPARRRRPRPGRALGRPTAAANSTSRWRRASHAGPTITLHLREDRRRSALRSAAARRSCAGIPTTSSRPILMRKEEWKDGKDEKLADDDVVNQAVCAVGAPAQRDQRRAVPGVLQARRATISTTRSPGPTRGSRDSRTTRSCSICRRARRSTSGIATPATGSSSTCAACSSWTTPSSCCRRSCASCAASSTRTICRSTSRAKSCRSRSDIEAIRGGCTRKVLDLLEQLADGRQGEVREVLGGVRTGAQGRRSARTSPNQRTDRGAAALRVDARRYCRRDAYRSPNICGRTKERPGQDLLRHGRHVQRGEEQPSPRDLSQARAIEVLLLSDRVDEWVVEPSDASSAASHWHRSRRAASISDALDDAGGRAEAPIGVDAVRRWSTGSRPSLGKRVKDVRVSAA